MSVNPLNINLNFSRKSRLYRYSFNGQEKEIDITGANTHTSAEFWIYDTRLGRRWDVDPVLKHFMSPLSCFSDNPILRVDKKGNTDDKASSNNPNDPNKKGGKDKFHSESQNLRKQEQKRKEQEDAREKMKFDVGSMVEELTQPAEVKIGKEILETAESMWNSPIARARVPDILNAGAGFSGIFGAGASTSIEANWIIRGPEASFIPIITVTEAVGVGFNLDATLNVGGMNYTGPVQEISKDILTTSIANGNVGKNLSFGLTALGKGGIQVSWSKAGDNYLIGRQANFGLGLPCGPIPVNLSITGSNTFILE